MSTVSTSVSDTTLKYSHLSAFLLHLVNFGVTEWQVRRTSDTAVQFVVNNDYTQHRRKAEDPHRNVPWGRWPAGELAPVFFLLSAVNHGWAYFDFPRYLHWVDVRRQNPVRYWEYALSAACCTLILGQMSGISNVRELLGLVTLNAVMQFSGWGAEKAVGDLKNVSLAWFFEGLGFLCLAGSLSVLLLAFGASYPELSAEGTPDNLLPLVTSAIAVTYALYVVFGLVSVAYVRGADPTVQDGFRLTSFRQVELWFLGLSWVAKTYLGYLVTFGT